ncbi:hypothetical protein D5018_20125 [Parashewanella curva]|uniref:Uncharacterized protein n=1 Tax=Parashewanella curva TaxID=2338552 RepID=A0A3L8PTF6_9GAMM|nr:phage regulatory CII family protein [Parashewanella curva]RLV57893.1 hypothetical protein D5018_20125 [Parashewanella curva]
MFANDKPTHIHVDHAYREFAKQENIKDIALAAGFHNPQLLRNKLRLGQAHKLTVSELIKIVKVSGNRCIIDGLLLDLHCQPSMPFEAEQTSETLTLSDHLLKIYTNAGELSEQIKLAKDKRGVTNDIRHQVVSRSMTIINELRLLIQRVEAQCPLNSIVDTPRIHRSLQVVS